MTARPLQADISRFFDDFVEAFRTFDGARIATRYFVPGIALRGDGSIQSLESRTEVERFFQAAVDSYHRDGCRGIQWRDLDVVPMGDRSVLATVTWDLLREDRTVLRHWRQSYNLARVDPGWQIFASTYHVGS